MNHVLLLYKLRGNDVKLKVITIFDRRIASLLYCKTTYSFPLNTTHQKMAGVIFIK